PKPLPGRLASRRRRRTTPTAQRPAPPAPHRCTRVNPGTARSSTGTATASPTNDRTPGPGTAGPGPGHEKARAGGPARAFSCANDLCRYDLQGLVELTCQRGGLRGGLADLDAGG